MKFIESNVIIGGPRDGELHTAPAGVASFVEPEYDDVMLGGPSSGAEASTTAVTKEHRYFRRYITLGNVRIAYWAHDSVTESDVLVRLFNRYSISAESTYECQADFLAHNERSATEIAFLDGVVRNRLLNSAALREAIEVTFDVGDHGYTVRARLVTARRQGDRLVLTQDLKDALR